MEKCQHLYPSSRITLGLKKVVRDTDFWTIVIWSSRQCLVREPRVSSARASLSTRLIGAVCRSPIEPTYSHLTVLRRIRSWHQIMEIKGSRLRLLHLTAQWSSKKVLLLATLNATCCLKNQRIPRQLFHLSPNSSSELGLQRKKWVTEAISRYLKAPTSSTLTWKSSSEISLCRQTSPAKSTLAQTKEESADTRKCRICGLKQPWLCLWPPA